MHGTLSEVDGRPALRFERRLPHPVQRVWRAVTDPAELERWFVAPVPWTPREDESFEAAGQAGRILELDEPRVIAWAWGDERYRFELRADGDGCLLILTHVFDDRLGPAAQHAAGWEAYLDRLAAHLSGRPLSEEAATPRSPSATSATRSASGRTLNRAGGRSPGWRSAISRSPTARSCASSAATRIPCSGSGGR
jgi:uncharacterized protein YndB with AHSA1/START domain